MRAKYILSIILFLIFFSFTSSVSAQQSKLAQRWVCLQTDWCLDQTAFAQGKVVMNPDCKGVTIPNGHRVLLTAKSDAKPLPNKDTYIVECLETSSGEVCTTGNTTDDNLIYGQDNAAALNTSDNYQFQGIFQDDGLTPTSNPVTSLGNGDINPVQWQSFSKENSRKFLALNFYDPNGGNNWLGKGGQQQGTFSFETQSNLKNCISIAWDPYGRVFDSKSLEPIPGATVQLLKKRDNGQFTLLSPQEILGGAIINPYITKQDGGFSFVVPDGTYQLSASAPNYTFPNNASKLNSAYSNIYSDIYPSSTGTDIVQQGTVEHRDIPLDSQGEGIHYPAKLVRYFYNLDKATNTILIDGVISHPFTTIKAYSLIPENNQNQTLVRDRLVGTTQADKFGKFSLEINQSKFSATESFGDLELDKADLTALTRSSNPINTFISYVLRKFSYVDAAPIISSSFRFQPILSSLQGYAYDSQDHPLSNTTVGVYLTYANKPYIQTKTDASGLYSVSANVLPDAPYVIKYSNSQTKPMIISTSTFLADNRTYLSDHKINLNKSTLGGSIGSTTSITTAPAKPASKEMAFGVTNQNSSNGQLQTIVAAQSNNVLLIIGAILFFLIGGAGLMLGLYIMNKQKKTVY